MADPKLIEEFHNNEPQPDVSGGPQRPSKWVDLQRFDAIRRRQELNTVLLQRACGEAELSPPVFEPEDVALLLQIARERDPNGNPAIRKHAIGAMGQFRNLEAMDLLWEIASSTMEHEAIRGQALTSLARVAPRMAPALLERYLDDESALIRQATVNALAEIGGEFALRLLSELLEREQDIGVQQRASIAVQSIGKQLRVGIPRVKVFKRPKRPLAPESEP